jgi:hypothetical protein
LIYLDILGKNNCSFDVFYHKRAEDLLIGILKKGYPAIVNNEIFNNSIKSVEQNPQEEKENFLDELESNRGSVKMDSGRSSKQKITNIEPEILTSKIRGYIDTETKVNIIHFSCYDDSECVINTTDLFVTQSIFTDIYRHIFHEYSRIQSNINKLKNRLKQIGLRKLYSYESVSQNYKNVLRNDTVIKTKLIRDQYIKFLKAIKLNEYAVKLHIRNNVPIWVCCKIYTHYSLQEDLNFEEFSNYKIIFVAYESYVPVDLDSFCQDLLLNELFI